MYGLYLALTLVPPILLLLFGWIAGTKASRLVFGASGAVMRRKALKLITWTFLLTLPAAASGYGAVMLMQHYDPVFWQDRLYIQVPLIALPVVALWLIAVPRLLLLRRDLSRLEADASIPAPLRSRAAHPGIVVPFQASAWGAAAMLLIALLIPAPIDWIDISIPAAAALLIWYFLWMRHSRRSRKAANPEAPLVSSPWRSAAGGFGLMLLGAAFCGLFVYLAMEDSKLPDQIDMASGKVDFGGGSELVHVHGAGDSPADVQLTPVSALTGPQDGEPDAKFTLTAEHKQVKLSSGKTIDAWTFNGQIPGPQLRVKQGDLVEVTLINTDIEEGATLHWHGLDVPNAEDGVAGATQDAVMPGQSHTYRFVAEQTGTFWYHSHQDSQEAVRKGLFGSLIVDPADVTGELDPVDPAEPSEVTVPPAGIDTEAPFGPTLPLDQEADSQNQEAAPQDQGTLPLDQEGAPQNQESTPQSQESSPQEQDRAPQVQESPTQEQETSPQKNSGEVMAKAGTVDSGLSLASGNTSINSINNSNSTNSINNGNSTNSINNSNSIYNEAPYTAESEGNPAAESSTVPTDEYTATANSDILPDEPTERDFTVMTHLWDNTFAIGASDQVQRFDVAPGTPVRLRLINTDDWVVQSYMLVGTSFQVDAIDGTALHEPGELTNEKVAITTGGRYDLTFTMPDSPVYLSVGGSKKLGIFMSPDGKGNIPSVPSMTTFDPLHYGTPDETPFDASSTFDRSFSMVLDNKLGFYNGTFNQLYTMNGEVFPDTPMYMVREGDLVKMTIINRGMVEHPMHLHGHHALVLSRNGEAADGSPWWTDTLNVEPGETYEIAFRADNPGLWMDHCHNLAHSAAGMSCT